MNTRADTLGTAGFGSDVVAGTPGAPASAASWSAILAGAFVATSVTLVLFALGSGFGLASVSAWSDQGVSATTFTVTASIWLIVTQWLSAGLGGYVAGRLRTRWFGTHQHEVFFRDTAHGLVTWAVASLLIASVVAMSVTGVAGGGLHAASDVVAAGAKTAAAGIAPGDMYGVDKLFRSSDAGTSTGAAGSSADPRAETAHILAQAASTGSVPDADRTYLANLVASKSGVAPAEAQRRVDELIADAKAAQDKARAAADAARKAASETAIYTALSMLVGAFIACIAAALGGRQRDEHI